MDGFKIEISDAYGDGLSEIELRVRVPKKFRMAVLEEYLGLTKHLNKEGYLIEPADDDDEEEN